MNLTLILIISSIVFIIVILFLVSILLYAKMKLLPEGNAKIIINAEKEFESPMGDTLLTTLTNSKIFLPSACGGGGTCGMCKCQVFEGGGEILSTETGHLNRKQQADNWRLACQIKVKQDITISIPKEIFGIKKWECEVISNRNVATFIKEFVVKLPNDEVLDFEPGSYIQIDVPECNIEYKNIVIEDKFKKDWDTLNLWDLNMKNNEPIYRAYSMANYPGDGNVIMLNIRIATPPWDNKNNKFLNVNPGICSSYIFSRQPGDKVIVSGPYGDFHIKNTDNEMVYIGGGAGMAPLRSQIFHLFKTLKSNRKVSYWYGARSLREVFYEDEFREIERNFPNFKFNVALSEPLKEDNWNGYVGFIHNVVLKNYLSNHPEPEEIEYYLCGPPIMNESVLGMLDNLGVPDSNIALDDFGI